MARLDDGHPTTIEFTQLDSSLDVFWEQEVTPPGLDGGGANDTTTMRNENWRTMAPKGLITMTEMTLQVSYDSEIYDAIVGMANVNQEIQINFPDGSNVRFWGWLNSFTFDPIREGEQPRANVSVMCSNQNENGAEVGPVHTPAP
jgi:hypothetical protein